MVNKNKVNANSVCLPRAHLCVFFFVLARFLRLRNPVKYRSTFEINQKIHVPVRRATKYARAINNINGTTLPNTYARFICYVVSRSKGHFFAVAAQLLELTLDYLGAPPQSGRPETTGPLT